MNWRNYFDIYEDEPIVPEPIGSAAVAVIVALAFIGLALAGMA